MRLKLRATVSAGEMVPARWAATIAATVSVTGTPGIRKLSPDRSKRCAICTPDLQDGLAKINAYYQMLDCHFARAIGPGGPRLLILWAGDLEGQPTTLLLPCVISRAAR
jgi:hypothetical protein